MTQREMLNSIIAKAVITDEMVLVAQGMINKMDSKSSKEKAEAEKVNAPLKVAFVDYLRVHPKALASELAQALGKDISTSKVVALGKALANDGVVTVSRVKFPKVGERNVYSLVVTDEQ